MNVPTFLREHHIPFEELTHEPTYEAQRVAHAVHTTGKHVAKSVLLYVNHGFAHIVAVVPATCQVDLEAVSAAMGRCEMRLATEAEMAALCPDCEVGALPPFGSHYGMKTIVDQQLADEDEIVFASNTLRESICMRFDDYYGLEHPLILLHCAKGGLASFP
jgi:Ala-tRNA(Pro) deacylase